MTFREFYETAPWGAFFESPETFWGEFQVPQFSRYL